MNIGAGRVVHQELVRIGNAIADGSLAKAAPLTGFIGKLTPIERHLPPARADLARRGAFAPGPRRRAGQRSCTTAGVPTVLHAFTDGRDTPPQSAVDDLARVCAPHCRRTCAIATVCGRYFAMDRDKRWDRVAKAYTALADADGAHFDDPVTAVQAGYARGQVRRVHPPGGDRRLQGDAGRRRHPVLQLPRRPGPGNPRRPARSRSSTASPRKRTHPVRRRGRHDALFRRAGAVPRRVVPARQAGAHPGRRGGGCRQDPAPHGGDREIPARHLFPERRPGDALPARGPHHGAVPEGRHLRPAAGDVRRRN